MFRLNNPPRWLARALAVINGQTQLEIEDRLYPVVEVAQDGFGLLASIRSEQVDGSLATGITTTITCTEYESKRVRFHHFNPGSTGVGLSCRLRVGAGVSVDSYNSTTPAGSLIPWEAIGGGKNWYVVPPGCSLEIVQAIYVTTAGYIRLIEVAHPGGVNLS